MISFSPENCKFSEPIFHLNNGRSYGIEATIDPDILNRQEEICVRSTLKAFQEKVDKAITIYFPEIKNLNIPANNTPLEKGFYDRFTPANYRETPRQNPHKDIRRYQSRDEANAPAVGFFLRGERKLSTIIIPDEIFYSDEYANIAAMHQSKKDLHQALLTARLAYCINFKSGMSFLSDKNTHHARALIDGSETDILNDAHLHCFDQAA